MTRFSLTGGKFVRLSGLLILLGLPLMGCAGTRSKGFHDVSVNDALQSKTGQEKLLELPFFMSGQEHPPVTAELGIFKSSKRTVNGRGVEEKCRTAFLSAVISLQSRAQKMGGDAVVDIRSTTRNRPLDSADQFRCVAGNGGKMVNVTLEGRVVKFTESGDPAL